MLTIICKGKGLIPRVGMIAPVLTPFKVNFQTLTVIVRMPGSILKPYFVNPITLEELVLDITNYKKIYDRYQNTTNVTKEIKPEPTRLNNDDNNYNDEEEGKTINFLDSNNYTDNELLDGTEDPELITNINPIIKEDDLENDSNLITIGAIPSEDSMEQEEDINIDSIIPIITKENIDELEDTYISEHIYDSSKIDQNSTSTSSAIIIDSTINDRADTSVPLSIRDNKYPVYNKNKHHNNRK